MTPAVWAMAFQCILWNFYFRMFNRSVPLIFSGGVLCFWSRGFWTVVLTSLVVHFKVVCRNGSSQFSLHKLNAFMQAVPLLDGLAWFAAVTWELLSLQPDHYVPHYHPAQHLVGKTVVAGCGQLLHAGEWACAIRQWAKIRALHWDSGFVEQDGKQFWRCRGWGPTASVRAQVK